MIDTGSIAALGASLKTAGEIAKTMIGLRDTTLIQSKVIELQGVILSAQSSALASQTAQFELLERVRTLEKEMAGMKAWDTEKDRYELKKWGEGAFPYVLKESEARGEPIHAICPNCYQAGVKSILHSNLEPQWIKHAWCCSRCKTAIKASSQSLIRPAAT